MKKSALILPISLICLTTSLLFHENKNVINGNAKSNEPTYVTSLTKNINLNHSTHDEIRVYYSSLTSLPTNERQGTNLLKNLKPILQNMNYFSYENIWKIYEITDREWELSPADETTYGSYDSLNNTISGYEYGKSSDPKNDPYVKTLYRNRDESGVTVSEARIKEWGSHNNDGTNREHIWCQSRGFKADSEADGPAGTDLHHLRSGDAYINQSLHNDNPYGYVDPDNISKDGKDKNSFLSGNLVGKPLNKSDKDTGDVVFEPQDSDKGDIARAIFYMAACYNALDGQSEITKFNPNLEIVDYVYEASKAIISSETAPATMGKLSDLLEWHKLDPVDEFEIYRNDLIFNNYQHNRNPFIDFPGWVDVVWGNDSTLVADPSTNTIHGSAITISSRNLTIDISKQNSFTLSAKTIDNSPISWSVSDETIITPSKTTSNSDESVTFNVLKTGEVTIAAKATINGVDEISVCEVSIGENINTKQEFKLEIWMIVVIVIVIIIIIIILVCSSKARKKAKKAAKKYVKKSRKNK